MTETEDRPAPAPDRRSPGKRVLVVDDAITVRLYCRQLLEAEGYRVEEAVNGLEGLEKALTGEPFDLFVVDVNMMKMDGYTMLRRVRQEPALRGVPAVMMTTESKDADRRRALEAGANFYMTKPIRPEPFKTVVRLMSGRAAA